jgi:GGDEF domain-containing protein
LIQN